MHLDLDDTIATAGFTSSALDIEAESSLAVTLGLCVRRRSKQIADQTVKVFDDGRKMIDSGSCDAVLVATPHYLHPEFVIYALEHGLHAISEKPAGVYTKQVREMNEAAERSDRSFAIMLNQRTNCVYRKLHEMIQSGELGQLRRVNWIITDWYRNQSYYDAASWICCNGCAACL